MTGRMGSTDKLKTTSSLPAVRIIRVLIAEDSATIRYHLVSIIEEFPGMQVVGQARDGEEALTMVADLQPDVVSMDIRMPRMDGLEATRRIMAENPTPVVVVSSLVEKDIELSFQALEAGALAVVEKPPDRNNGAFYDKQRLLVRTLAAMADVSVVRRGYRMEPATPPAVNTERANTSKTPEIIAIGASAGGPNALSRVLAHLPESLPVPVVIAQHIAQEFVPGLARWLNKTSPLRVEVAEDSQPLQPGVIYLSPGSAHLMVRKQGDLLVARLMRDQGLYRYQPSVNVLFESVANVCGPRAIGLVLTGMGDDGASGLLAMRREGARTLAQDEASSTVFGMPGTAIARGAVEKVISLADIPSAVLSLL